MAKAGKGGLEVGIGQHIAQFFLRLSPDGHDRFEDFSAFGGEVDAAHAGEVAGAGRDQLAAFQHGEIS
ncbi:hypothetical protein D3C71_1795230 [compost metagenome]